MYRLLCIIAVMVLPNPILPCGQTPAKPASASARQSQAKSTKPAAPKHSKITVDTFGCRTVELFYSAFKRMAENEPLPQGCFDVDALTRVRGPYDVRTTRSENLDSTYALIEVPQKGRLWVFQNHIEVFPDSVAPALSGRPLRLTAEEFVRTYNDAQFRDEQVIVTGVVHSANSQIIEVKTANSIILEFSSSGPSRIADFPRAFPGQKATLKGKCLGRGLKDKQRFFFEASSILR